MGGGASTIMMNSPREGMISEVNNANDAGTAALDRRLRRQRIFEKGEANPELDINVLLDGEYIDEATRKTLIDALGGFYFLRGGTKDPKMDMLLRAMQKEVFEEGFLLINEGEPGSKLYIVDTGELEVTINGEKIRDMGKGSMLGELALLYDAPRSATVRCKTKCVLWSLKREVFKQIQAVSASQIQMQRARWLINSPDLAVLSAIDFSRLVGTLQGVPFRVGEPLYKEGAVTSQILIVEKGTAHVYTSKDLSDLSKDDIDKHLGIIRPRSSKSPKSEDQLSPPVPSNKVRMRCGA
jgi:CRP-like cAMP-binding protein